MGHSFGGLVIEQAVVNASSAGSMYRPLVDVLGGVILLGTPHQGSKVQKWASIVANLASLIECGQTVLMDEVDEKSMSIFDLVWKFTEVAIQTGLARSRAAMCFYENLPTDYSRRVGILGGLVGHATASMVCIGQK